MGALNATLVESKTTAKPALFEAPPLVTQRFEHDLLNIVQKVRALGPEVATIVQPSLRRRTTMTLWVYKWNQLQNVPCIFQQTCSCKAMNDLPGCHFTYLIGAIRQFNLGPCSEVPTLSATSQASLFILG